MKSKLQHQTKTVKTLFLAFAFLIGMGLSNKALACAASFTYTTGVNGLVHFTSTSGGVGPTTGYTWNPGDGNGFVFNGYGNSNTYSYYYQANGTYTAMLCIYDSLNSCNDTARVSVTVSNVTQPCNLSASGTANIGGDGQVKFTSTSLNTNANTLYFWNFGDGSPRVQGKDTITHKYTYSNFYTVWIVIQDTGNAYCIDSNVIYINVTNGDSNMCSQTHPYFTYTNGLNGQVNFTSTSLVYNNPAYVWNPGDGSGPVNLGYNGTSYSHFYQTNGTFNAYLTLVGDSNNGCIDSIILPVTVSNVSGHPCNMVAGFTMIHDSNGTEEFVSTSTDTIYGNSQYFWDPGDGSGVVQGTSHFTHTYNFIGYYNPSLTVEDTGVYSCQASSWDTLNIWNRDSLQARFVYVADSGNVGQYDFTSTSLGTNQNTYYKWTPGDGSPADSGLGMNTYTHVYSNNGPYSATLTVWYTVVPHVLGQRAEAGSPHISESSYTLVVNVNTATGIASVVNNGAEFSLYPNPNNGQFKLQLTNLPESEKAEVSITNLLGEVIYQNTATATGINFMQDINLQGTPAGMYFVKVVTAGKVFTSRVVIAK